MQLIIIVPEKPVWVGNNKVYIYIVLLIFNILHQHDFLSIVELKRNCWEDIHRC